MPTRVTGRYERTTISGEEVAAFVPYDLPPARPPIELEAGIAERLRAADHALTRLVLVGEMVPSLDWFIYAFVRKEAVLSSQIEGRKRPSSTSSTLKHKKTTSMERLMSRRSATTSTRSLTRANRWPVRRARRCRCAYSTRHTGA